MKNLKITTRVLVLALFLLFAGVATHAATAAPPPPPPGAGEEKESHVIMEWDEFKKVTDWDDRAKSEAEKNQFIIPWTEIQDLFGIKITGVDSANLNLPWREFKTLLEWSIREAERKKQEKQEEIPAPTPYLITSAQYVSEDITKDGALFTATFKIEILEKKSWKKIPLLPTNVAIREVKLPAGVYLQTDNTGYILLARDAATIEAEISFSTAVTEASGISTINFTPVPSAACLVDLTLPMKDVDIQIPGAQSKLLRQVGDTTRLVAALASGSPLNIQWERAVPEAEKAPPQIYSETRTLVSVADGLFIGSTQLSINVLHTPTRQLTLRAPTGASVLEVTARDLRDWRAAKTGEINLQFSRDVIGPLTLDIQYEQPISEDAQVPVITAQGVEREKGHVAVVALTSVEIKSRQADGAHSVDVKTLPPEILGMTNQPVLLAWRYVTPDFKIALDISKHEDVEVLLTVIDRAHYTIMQTFDGRRISRALFNVRNNRNQFLRLKMPEGAELWNAAVAGKATQPARDQEGRVLLPLVRSRGTGDLSSFPVEITYFEEGIKPDERGRGQVRIDLPDSSEPITHLMISLYVPEEGKYDEFDGTLRKVDAFSRIARAAGAAPTFDPVENVQQLQQSFVAQNQIAVKATGASPIEVELPITGKVHYLEKILVVKDPQWFSYDFTGLVKKDGGLFGM